MANEVKWAYAPQVTLEANGGAVAANAFGAADDTNLGAGNHQHYPVADLVLKCAFGGAPAAGGVVNIYRRDHDIDGANDAPEPSATFPYTLVGVVPIPAATEAYYPIPNVPLSQTCQFYIENKTNQSLSAGWTLKATPKTYVPAA